MNDSSHLLIASLDAALRELASCSHFLVGLSGGLDSAVLLHALVQLRERSGTDLALRAIHVNHHLQSDSGNWATHCERLCADLGVELVSVDVTLQAVTGIENAARDARYREFEAALLPNEELLLAHHRDDQMETLLLRLTRGAGSRGLAGIPRKRDLGASQLLRPLLDVDRDELRRYAEAVNLSWVEDESNDDESFDRNYCRHSVLPLIEARWPSYRDSWSKSATLAGESELLLAELATIDLSAIATEHPSIVHRERLLALSEPRRRNVLRHWLNKVTAEELGWNQLQRLSKEVLQGEGGRFISSRFQLHCFRDHVYVLDAAAIEHQPEDGMAFQLSGNPAKSVIELANNGSLRIQCVTGEGLRQRELATLVLRYRAGGEVCKLAGRPSKSLKKILQDEQTPPWLRGRQPLLFSGEQLVCIPGIGVSEEFAAAVDEPGYLVHWQQPRLAL